MIGLITAGFVAVESEPRCGVYALCFRDEVVYIGQSTDLHKRIAAHRAEGIKLFDGVLFYPVAQADLDAFEGALIRYFKPKHNSCVPCGGDLDAEVLAVFGLAPKPSHSECVKPERIETDFAIMLRSARDVSGKSQTDIARSLSVSQAVVSKWEGGLILPRDLAAVAVAYGLELDALTPAYFAARSA